MGIVKNSEGHVEYRDNLMPDCSDYEPCVSGQDIEKAPKVNTVEECNQLIRSCSATFTACIDILIKKGKDYASMENPYANFEACTLIDISVEKGILVRMLDKLKRTSNLLDHEAYVTDETLEDTLRDLINYSAILIARRQANLKDK
jgi:hypothetical protein